MFEEMLVRHGSPTLAGIKTGSLFSCACPCRLRLTAEIRQINRKLIPKGLRLLPLRVENGRALIYLYRPNALACDFMHHLTRSILEENGYVPDRCNQCVVHLMRRIQSNGDFPHEIGLFLGYPPEDVLGFVQNRAGKYKCVGCWKVYGDVAAAQCVFQRYAACTRAYRQQWDQGKSIERLIVTG